MFSFLLNNVCQSVLIFDNSFGVGDHFQILKVSIGTCIEQIFVGIGDPGIGDPLQVHKVPFGKCTGKKWG